MRLNRHNHKIIQPLVRKSLTEESNASQVTCLLPKRRNKVRKSLKIIK